MACRVRRRVFWVRECVFESDSQGRISRACHRQSKDFTLPHRLHWTPPDLNSGLCWCDMGQIRICSLLESSRLQQTPVESSRLQQTPVDSSGIQLRLTSKVLVFT